MRFLLSLLFGCPHSHTTFPLTPVRGSAIPKRSTYVVCLDCGAEFAYDWKQMRIAARVEAVAYVGGWPPIPLPLPQHPSPPQPAVKGQLL